MTEIDSKLVLCFVMHDGEISVDAIGKFRRQLKLNALLLWNFFGHLPLAFRPLA